MPPATRTTRIRAIVPAAGAGRRMGRAKQTLAYGSSTMVATVVNALLDVPVDGVVVVTRAELVEASRLPDDPRVVVAFNEDPSAQMIDSVRIGLRALSGLDKGATEQTTGQTTGQATGIPCMAPIADRNDAQTVDGIMVVPADMPMIRVDSYRRCVAEFSRDPSRLVIGAYGSRRGHPMIIPAAMIDEIGGLSGGLNELPRRFPNLVREVAVDDAGVVRDVDTREDYEELTGG
ncbi:MAG: nucleotidyltransferase family protein [Planctomycetes bacterium]|nr:nucleotidyltransferase family protein [Planctomycetota bacterium]